jgi:carbon-monoxide dehydrogenase large subunit
MLGNSVRRVEDPSLLRGDARYLADLEIPGVLSVAFARSPFAHATVTSISIEAASAMPGVVAVYLASDLGVDGVPPPFGKLNEHVVRPALASDRVRFVGDPVAIVIAETVAHAVDATEMIEVEYEPLDAAAGIEEAAAPGAPLAFPATGTNVIAGAREAEDIDVFAEADVVVRARIENQRVAVAPMEGGAIAVVPGDDGHMTIYASTQMSHRLRDQIASVLGLEAEKIHLITPWVGGAFGGKVGLPGEQAAVVAAALKLGRPVRYIETRSENLIGMHGRSQVQYGELGLRRDGTFVGLRVRGIGDSGAYGGFGGGLVAGSTRLMAQGVYEIPRIHFDAAVSMTNTSPTGAFRGAGRPEAAALLERLVDIGAAELGIDPVEIRRRNFISADDFPYRTVTGALYDCGDYPKALDEALRVAGYAELREEQARRRAAGASVQLGIGIACYVEVTAGGGGGEFGSVEIADDGHATIRVGTVASGQGHATAFSMLVADRLGIPIEQISFIQADTAEVARGSGTGGSRSLQLGGTAVSLAAGLVFDQGRKLAADLLEADPEDIVITEDHRIGVSGVPARALGWGELASEAKTRGESLAATSDFAAPGATFPFGAHISVVEVDTETGMVWPLRHIAVDDAGRVLNPLLVAGQQHGGIAQGISQALWEEVRYDEDANPQTGTFATYCIPSAAELIFFEASNTETPTPYNPLGAKGIGESATVGSTPAVQNAVVDALAHLGVRHIDMPCTPERVWKAIEDARSSTTPEMWHEPPDIFGHLARRARPVFDAPDEETV